MKRALLTILFLWTAIQPSSGQAARIYTAQHGLESTQINCLAQDGKGYIWIGSQAGLTCFDGMEFRTYNCENVSSILEDSMGRLWTGTATGLQLFDVKTGTFTRYDFGDSRNPGNTQYISDIKEVSLPSSEPALVISTSSDGLYILESETLETDSLRTARINAAIFPKRPEKTFTDSRGNLWICCVNGGMAVVRYDSGSPLRQQLWDPGLERISGSVVINDIIEDPATGKVILGTYGDGLLIYEHSIGRIRRPRGRQPSSMWVSALQRSRVFKSIGENLILVGKGENGFNLFDPLTEEFVKGPIPFFPQSTDKWKVNDLLLDSQGNIWAAGYQYGLMVVPESTFGFERYRFSVDGNRDENSASVTGIYYDETAGRLWAGTDGAGLFSLDQDGVCKNYNSSGSGLGSNSLTAVDADGSGRLWVGTFRDGLYTRTSGTGFRKFRSGVMSEGIKTLLYDKKSSRMYVGTSGDGVFIVNTRTMEITDVIAGQDGMWVSALAMGDDGLLWIGTYNGPLCFNPVTGGLRGYKVSDDAQVSRIYALSVDGSGTVWMGTGGGLISLDPDTETKKLYTEADGLSNNIIKSLCCDDGSVWISTNNGISRLDTGSGKFSNFYATDGLQGNEFHTGAGFRSPGGGKLWFGGNDGVSMIEPGSIQGSPHRVPPVNFTRMTVMGEPSDIRYSDSVKLESNSEYFTIGFCVLEYTNPERIRYAYMLEGFDKGWRYADPDSRSATYTNVPRGRYKFTVKAYYRDDEEHFSVNSLEIEKKTPWFLKWWAILIYVLIFTILTGMATCYISEIRKQKKARELDRIKEMRLGMFTNLTHEIRTPLHLVMSPLKKLRESGSYPELKETYNLMYRNCLRINRIVNQLMDIRKIDNGQLKLHFVETDIVYFINDIMQSFSSLASDKGVVMSLDSDRETVPLWIDQGNFDKVIFNILSNAFRYTPEGGRVEVGIRGTKDGFAEISIFNSGNGISDKDLEKVFERFFQANPQDVGTGSGVGLNLSKMLVELHHGSIKAVNKPGGVAFIVRIPEGNRHLTVEELSASDHHKDLYTRIYSSDDVAKAQVSSNSGSRKTKARKTLVIAEDDVETLEFMQRELSGKYNVILCPDGQKAWTEITRVIPDAVVTDILMPVMDGKELCAKIRHSQSTNHIPVIFLTSLSDDDTEKLCNEVGADKFYSKPVAMDILESGIAQAIASRTTMKGKYGSDINNDYDRVKMPFDRNNLIKDVVEYIKEHLDDTEMSVETISAEMGMSRVHLNRRLKESGSVSPNALIKSIRLKQAAYLLVHSKVNVSEVAYQVGFATHSYFTRAFHDYFGMTPKEFVLKYQNDPDNAELARILE